LDGWSPAFVEMPFICIFAKISSFLEEFYHTGRLCHESASLGRFPSFFGDIHFPKEAVKWEEQRRLPDVNKSLLYSATFWPFHALFEDLRRSLTEHTS